MVYEPIGLTAIATESAPRVVVGPGCTRYDLPSRPGVRVWVVDIEAGSVWPHVDHHDALGEDVFVVSGEVIEGEARYAAGTFVHFSAHSSHRPHSERGVRLFGFNLVQAAERAPPDDSGGFKIPDTLVTPRVAAE